MKRTTQPKAERAVTSMKLDPHLWKRIKRQAVEKEMPAVRIVEEALELWLRAQKVGGMLGVGKR